MEDNGPFDPVVIDPPGVSVPEEWNKCAEFVEQCGGVTAPDGEVNWRAAFGADPGVCTCPACGVYYWSFGNRQRCAKCGFEFPVDWWSMYSWGVSATRQAKLFETHPGLANLHQRRLAHPYYRYGFEHPVGDAWKEHDKIAWRDVLA